MSLRIQESTHPVTPRRSNLTVRGILNLVTRNCDGDDIDQEDNRSQNCRNDCHSKRQG